MSETSSSPTLLSHNFPFFLEPDDKLYINLMGEECYFQIYEFVDPWFTGTLYFVGYEDDAEYNELHKDDIGNFVYKIERERNNGTDNYTPLEEPTSEEQASFSDFDSQP